MRGGVVLIFDEALEGQVAALAAALVRPHRQQPGGQHPPAHITLIGADGLGAAGFAEGLANIAARYDPIPLRLGAVASFLNPGGVLYLAPSVTAALARLHEELRELALATGATLWQYFSPDSWTPHCTLAIGLDDAQILAAVDYVRAQTGPLYGQGIALLLFELVGESAVERARLAIGARPGAEG